ncbi:MAG: DUF4390 domain-containing protein [Thermoanaerobaculum sp.]|nr:DUF4390 domain-containing protein [Thermoanaerobaculum sp.]MDW7966855.1 DUF4390 domain-containing protein [Thermoanaerobaculum sp.]
MVLAWVLLAAVVAPELEVSLTPAPGRLLVQITLHKPIPEDWVEGLEGGAPVAVTYRLKVFRNRRFLWDQRLANHELVVRAQREPVSGVISLQAELDGEVLASSQTAALEQALQWVSRPPTAELPIPLHHEPLWLLVRAEFLTRYKLLVIPVTEGTEWVTRAVPEAP